jgi:small subunit ribosomal protein S9
MAEERKVFLATGRRKEAIACVKLLLNGQGKFLVNGKDAIAYFANVNQKMQIKKPLNASGLEGKIDVIADVRGGGIGGQAGAVSLGIARALTEWNPQLRTTFRKEDLLTRDPRSKERKKYGRKGARRRFQWTKR